MPEDEQIELVDAHPRLGAPPASVSAASFVEQGYDRDAAAGRRPTPSGPGSRRSSTGSTAPTRPGSGSATASSWRAARGAELLPGFAAALAADRRAELARALDAVSTSPPTAGRRLGA